MGNFSKDIYMKGCRLIIRMYGDTSNMYQFVFNPDTAQFSDIYPCNDTGLEFEIEDDGVYRIVTFQKDNAELIDDGIKIGNKTYTAEDITSLISDEVYYNPVEIGIYDVDDTLSICKLKKCLAELELKAFQEMLKNCGKMKCKTDGIKTQIDFLFIAVWLIEHYLEVGNIERAKAIYERMKGCGNLCQNLLNDKRSCGCDG